MPYRYALFDLDGTLTDPAEGITNSVIYALKKFGKEVSSREELYPYIGPPLLESFEKYHGLTPAQAREGLRLYREYFSDRGIFENTVYDGIPPLLERLRSAGVRLFVATSKPEYYARQIMAHFHLEEYFDFIGGSTMDETRVRKEEVIRYVLERTGVSEPARAVMVGDRGLDVTGAEQCGMDAIGVLYGYGGKEELQRAGARYLVSTTPEIGDIILKYGRVQS